MCGCTRSLKLRCRVAVSLESTIDYIGALVVKIGHGGLVHWPVPWDISDLSGSVSVAGLVVLMEDWSLSGSPLSVGIWHWWVSWKHSGHVPPEEVWVVRQSSVMELMIVEDDWSLVSQTSAETLTYEEINVEVCNTASPIETLDWKFSYYCQPQKASQLCPSGIVCGVPVRSTCWSNYNFVILWFREPRSKDTQVVPSLRCPFGQPLFHIMCR